MTPHFRSFASGSRTKLSRWHSTCDWPICGPSDASGGAEGEARTRSKAASRSGPRCVEPAQTPDLMRRAGRSEKMPLGRLPDSWLSEGRSGGYNGGDDFVYEGKVATGVPLPTLKDLELRPDAPRG